MFVYLKCWEWWRQFIYVWNKHILDIKRVSLGEVWKNREPQANNWLNTRKCALKRRDLAIEDGIIAWWVAAGSGEGLTLKLSLTLQSLPEGRGTEAKLLGWSYWWVLLQPRCVIRMPCVWGQAVVCFQDVFLQLPDWIYLWAWLLSERSSFAGTWERLQLHPCATQGLRCSAGVITASLPEPAEALLCVSQVWVRAIIHNRCRSQFCTEIWAGGSSPHPRPFSRGHESRDGEGTKRGSVWVPASSAAPWALICSQLSITCFMPV